jgi:hypothetical protein
VLRSRSPFVLILGVVGMATPAAADRASYHATASGDIAFTDNVFSERRGNQDGDLFFQVRPGLLLSYGMPRMIHDLNLEAEVTQYALHGQEASLTGRGGWRAFFIPGPRSEVLLQINAGTGVLSSLTARTSPEESVVQLQPEQPLGGLQFRGADGSQFFSYIVSRQNRISERVFGRVSETDDHLMEPTVVTAAEAGGSISFEHRFLVSSMSLDAGGSVLRLERLASPGAPIGSRLDRQLNPRLRLAWRRDIDRRISANIDGGLVYVIPFGRDPYNPTDVERRRGLFPVIGGQLAYTDVFGVSTLSLRRDVTPNLLIAQNTVSDVAMITAAMPIPWREDNRRRAPKLVGLGSLAVMRTQLVDPVTSDLQASFGVARVDVGIQYAVRPGFSYTFRYELMVQSSNRDSMGEQIPGFFRNTFYFSFKVRWPEELAAQVPKRRGNAIRADRDDLSPLGAEPVIPDLLEEDGGEGER